MDTKKLQKRLSGLPPRMPRGHPQNYLRALMTPHLIAGDPPKEAKRKAIEEAKLRLIGILRLEKGLRM